MGFVSSEINRKAYQDYQVFEKIEHMMDYLMWFEKTNLFRLKLVRW